jgi:hypothetical protein
MRQTSSANVGVINKAHIQNLSLRQQRVDHVFSVTAASL